MPRKVTYGVSGLIDWCATIKAGKAKMRVHFTGGALTKYGITPAEFTTTDPLTQKIIESSQEYQSGRITILRSVGRPDRPRTPKATAQASTPTLPMEQAMDDTAGIPSETQIIEMPCIEDAIEYMRQNFGISSIQMHSVDALNNQAARHNIKFKFTCS